MNWFRGALPAKSAISDQALRELLKAHGSLRSQSENEWTGEIPLPAPLADFYRNIGPENITISGYGNSYFLPSLSDLWRFQAGYRWNGTTQERLQEWEDDWVVVGDEGGDPFIFSVEKTIILFAHHGAGEWAPKPIFGDINTFAACLTAIGKIVDESGHDFTDDDSMIRDQYVEKLTTDLSTLLGSQKAARQVLDQLGYVAG